MKTYESLVHPGLLNDHLDEPRKAELVDQYFGYRGRALAQRLVQDVESAGAIDSETLAYIDQIFYKKLQDRYGLEGLDHTKSVFLRQLKHANEVPTYIVGKALPSGMEHVYGLRNLVDLPCDSPAELLAQSVSSNDPIEAFETQRMLMLAELSVHFHMRNMKEQPYKQLREIHKLLCQEFYVPEQRGVSNTTHLSINATHDNDTNEYLGRADSRTYGNDHIKQHIFQARRFIGSDGLQYNALTQIRKKSDKVSIMKAIDKSRGKDTIDIGRSVTDTTGMMIAVLGNEQYPSNPHLRAEVADRVLTILQYAYGSSIDIREDGNVDARSASGGRNWQRYQVFFDKKSLPLELIFLDEKGLIDSSVKVGDLENPKDIDRAHSLYEVTRAQRMFPIIFPPHIYNGSTYQEVNEQLPALMAKKIESEAQQLLALDRCNYMEEWFD